MNWGGALGILAVVIIIGLLLKFGTSSTNLAVTAEKGIVGETNALTLSNIPAQTVTPAYTSAFGQGA